MRAVRLVAPNTPLAEVEIPDLTPGPGEVRVEVRACGVCHSDAHYRAGFGNVAVPRTLGHEIAGVVSGTGERVAVHYLRACGICTRCVESGEQFCERGEMIGKHCDGGYAESIVVPAANLVPIPDNVPFDAAALMMCSTATAYHALRVGGFAPGMRVALLGFGGLGVSALQLSLALGAKAVAVVDVVPEKLAAAERMGAMPGGDLRGFDLALDFTGRPEVAMDALRKLAPKGRLVLIALSEAPITFNPYRDILSDERSIRGCSDHLKSELFELMDLAASGRIDIASAISSRIPLEARAINDALDQLDRGTSQLRQVIYSSTAQTSPP